MRKQILYVIAMIVAFPAAQSFAAAGTVAGSVEAVGSSPSQITVLSYFSGDDNRDGSVKVEYSSDSSFSTSNTACEKVTGGSPRVCYISKLDSSKTYYVRVTYSDPDGVSGSATQTASATTKDSQDDIYPPTLSIIKPMEGGVVGGNSQYPVTIDFTVYDRHSGIDTSYGVQVVIDGATYNAEPNSERDGYYIFRWSTPTKGWHSVTAKARDKAGNVGYAPTAQFYVNSTELKNGIFAGDGKVLVRDNDNQICWDCHGGIKPHSSQHLSSKYGNWSLTCRQCHTPHNTKNIFLVKEQIKTPNSGVRNMDFRVAISRDETTSDPSLNTSYSFTNKANPGYGPCETCHTRTRNANDTPRYRNTGSGPGDGSHQNPPFTTSPCIRCHDHKRGFSPLSQGNIACNVCHPKQFDPMNGNTSTYHMYIQNAETSPLSGGIGPNNKYPSKPQPTVEDDHRRCMMCHTDMDLVNDSVNKDTPGMAYNQRISVKVAPVLGDASTHTNTDFRGDLSDGGICLSCHKNEQTKNNAKKKNDGTTKTPPWDVAKFGESAHNFTVTSIFNSDNTEFKANCAKCHNDDLIKDFQRSQYKFGLHDTKNRSLLSNINSNLTYTETSLNSTEEHFCYQCHSTSSSGPSDYNPNGDPSAAKDAYNVQPMRDKAVLIKQMFESDKKSFHPINGKSPYDSLNGLGSAAGKHKVDEWMSLPSGVQTANWNPASSRHVECTDCHNPHAASKEPRNLITWRPNPFDPTGGSFGGQVGGANKGVWGIEPTYDSSAWKAPTKFAVLETSENMYQFCFKCHSAYAYGAGSSYGIPATAPSPPQIPMGKFSGSSSSGSSWGGSSGSSSTGSWSSGPETEMSVEFNPNNYGFHPILRRGRNQPKPHLNSAWPYFNGGAGNGYGWQVGSSSSGSYSRWGGSSDDSTSGSTPNGAGHVNYNAATRAVTIADGRDFPTYYLQPGWRIQFSTDRPSSSQTWYEIKTVDSAKQITLVSGPSSSLSNVTFVASAGLGWAFVPPYGPWSTITCADCHRPSDESDPAGPHGSDNPWLLRNVDTKARVDNNLDGDIDDSVDAIDAGSWGNPKMFCYSCHRRDVYGTKAAGGSSGGHWGGWGDGADGEPEFASGTYNHIRYSRLDEHPPLSIEMSNNAWGVWCMNCHGGDSLGGLHGSNKSAGSDSGGGWGGGGGGSTPMGVRLRNGAATRGHSISSGGGSCSWGDASSFANCSGWSGSASYSANYNYTGVE